jgi:hypothetical protein
VEDKVDKCKVQSGKVSAKWKNGCKVEKFGEPGCLRFRLDVITHGGSNRGFQALIAASVRSKSGFVIATNGDTGFEVIKQVVSGDRMKRFLNMRV